MRVRSITKKIRRKGTALGRPTIEIDIGVDGKETKAEDILHEIRKVKACSRIAFIGIDPLIYQIDILEFLGQIQAGWEIIIETTGGVMPDLHLRERVTAWEVNIPKENTSIPFLYNEDAIRFYSTQKTSTFEWEVRGEQDLIEVKKGVFKFNLPWKRVILSPDSEWSDNPVEIQSQFKWLEDFCMEKGCSMGNPIIRSKKKPRGQNANNHRNTNIPGKESPGRPGR